MAHVVAHTFVSPVVDEGDPDLVGPDEWNANHAITIDPAEISHGGLADLGLPNDDHPQYAFLFGRTGGQTLFGGDASGDGLELYATADDDGGSILIGRKPSPSFDPIVTIAEQTNSIIVDAVTSAFTGEIVVVDVNASGTVSGNIVNATTGYRFNNTATSGQYLRGNGTNIVLSAIQAGDLPGSFAGFANPTATIGLSVVNGSATTAMRSDAAPPLSQAITPTWTGTHTWSIAGPTGQFIRLSEISSGNIWAIAAGPSSALSFVHTNLPTTVLALTTGGVADVNTGFRVGGAATSGSYLRGNGTNIVLSTIQAADLPGSFSGFANPTATIGLSVVNGAATTAMRSDAAPPLSQAIQPVWTALHTFLPTYTLSGGVGANTVVISGVHNVSSAVSETHGLLISPTFNVTTSNTLAAAISNYIFTTTGSSGGAITNLFASYNVANYGTIKPATAIGSYIGNFGSTGITTSYGLWVENQTGATTSIGIYAAGGQNRIVGATTIGSNNAPVSATGVVLNLNTGGGTGVDHIMVLGPSTSAGGLNVAYGGASFGSGISFINAHSPSAGTAEFRVLTQANSLTSWHNTDGGLRHGFYIRVGAFTAPSNTTVGDITATRAFFPNAALAGSNSAGGAIQSVKSFTPNGTSVGGTFNAVQYIGATVTPTNTGSATAFNTDVLYVNTDVQVGATGSGSSFFNGINSTITHSTGAGTTTGVRAGYYVMINSSGTTTLGIGVSANLVVTGGTVTTGVGVDVQMTRSAGTLTTSIGIRINANAPGTVGTNIAIQSLSGEHRFVGSVKIGANSSPAVPLDVVGAITTDTGYRIGNAAAATSILAGDGTNFVAQFTGNNVVAFSAGNFTASNSQTWTVASGDQLIYNYMRVGKWMTVTFFIQSSTLSGAADFFFLAIPGGLFPDGYYYNTCRVLEGVTYHPNAIVQTVAGQSKLYISKNIGGIFSGDQWAAGTDNYYILGEITFPVT